MVIVFQKVQTYLLLSPGNSLILDFNPVSVRPILTHPESDTFLRFNKDFKIQSTSGDRWIQAKQEATLDTQTWQQSWQQTEADGVL